ncbi:winged helix-turn-helix domain-containing protein, partial [Enterococcus faecium]|nr:winged helix-turn-helix domain-containing protein [Enterococcus faecium]
RQRQMCIRDSIKKLRQKIEKVGPQVIQTVWGVGYKFDDSGVA